MKTFFKKTVLSAGFLFALFLLLELTIRIWGYSEQYIYDPIYREFAPDKGIAYAHKPDVLGARGRGGAIVNTDSLGLRSKKGGEKYGPKQANEYRIVILGDSVAFGQGIREYQDTFAQLLEDCLNQKQEGREVKIFNYGTSGYSVKEMAATLEYRALEVKPDLVILAVIPDDFRLQRSFVADSLGYTVHKSLSPATQDPRINRLLRELRLTYLARDIWYRWVIGPRRVGASDLAAAYPQVKRFQSLARQNNLSYAVLLLPSLNERFKLLPLKLKEDKVPFIDVSFLAAEFSAPQFMAGKNDRHPSKIVHRSIAGLLCEYILKQKVK